jgi:hypothetical protein
MTTTAVVRAWDLASVGRIAESGIQASATGGMAGPPRAGMHSLHLDGIAGARFVLFCLFLWYVAFLASGRQDYALPFLLYCTYYPRPWCSAVYPFGVPFFPFSSSASCSCRSFRFIVTSQLYTRAVATSMVW